jgi:hypothetical protein
MWSTHESRTIITEPNHLPSLQSTQGKQTNERPNGVMADKVSKKDMTAVKASLSTVSSDRKTNKVAGSLRKVASAQRTPSKTAKPKTPSVPVKGKK